MTLQDALKKLNIYDYYERIFNSNSHGELIHLQQYFDIADIFKDEEDAKWFRKWFEDTVKEAEKTWKRPESVFQHIHSILLHHIHNN